MLEWLQSVLDAEAFAPRGQCGQWTPGWRTLAIVIDLLYGISYVVLPIFLASIARARRADMGKLRWGLIAYALFILGCGVSHLCQILVWWWPAYRFFVVVSLPGALMSIATAVYMPVLWWHCMRLPTPYRVMQMNRELVEKSARNVEMIDRLERINRELKATVDSLEEMRKNGVWTAIQNANLTASVRILKGISEESAQ